MGVIEPEVRRQQLLGGRRERRASATKIEQQPAEGEGRIEEHVIGPEKALGDHSRGDRKGNTLPAGTGMEHQDREVLAFRQPDRSGRLPGSFPHHPRFRIDALGDVDELHQFIPLLAVEDRALGSLQRIRILVQVRRLPEHIRQWRDLSRQR
jgi:hypothetical protein